MLVLPHIPKLAPLIRDAERSVAVMLPVLVRALQSGDTRLQESSARQVQAIAPRVPYAVAKAELLPRLCTLACDTTSAPVRVHALAAVGKLVPTLCREDVESILAVLRKVLAADRSSATCMAAIGIGDAASRAFGPEITALKVMPLLSPLLVVPGLSDEQFSAFAAQLRGMIGRVEAKRRRGSNAPAATAAAAFGMPATLPTMGWLAVRLRMVRDVAGGWC